jgi:D-3-phosphoglycerate dehydrogenase
MEMIVVGSDPYLTEEQAANHGVELVDLPTLLERADVVTVHVPLTRATRGIIGRKEIARLKPGSIVLNVARGGIVDEAAVAAALESGHLAGAGFDVFEIEPPTDSPLLSAPNILLTPHLGASTAEAQVLVAEEVAGQVLDVLEGRSARYAVNAPLLTPETARVIGPYLPLAEILGRFFAQFSRGGVRTLTLEIAGELAEHDASPLTAAVLRGLLETVTTERVNLVNAGALAKARGISLVERKTRDAGAYATQLTLSSEGSAGGADHRRRDGRRRRAADHPARRLSAGHGADRRDAHHPPHRQAGHGRADRRDARRGRREHQRDASRPDTPARGRVDDPRPRRRRVARGRRRIRDLDAVLDLWTIRLGRDR